MRQDAHPRRRFAERSVEGRDDRGELEIVTIWIDRENALWRVGRVINLRERDTRDPRPEDVVFEGYEMGDALEAANTALEGDLAASADNDDHNRDVLPFAEAELQKKLERWFFDHA
jgi:hypothetical protein